MWKSYQRGLGFFCEKYFEGGWLKVDLWRNQNSKKNRNFKILVRKKVRICAFQCLLSKIKSKGMEIVYKKNLQCQTYLLAKNILTFHEQRAIFSFRTRMNFIKNNFKGNNSIEYCQCESEMTNKHLYECILLNNSEKKIPYETITISIYVQTKIWTRSMKNCTFGRVMAEHWDLRKSKIVPIFLKLRWN